MAPRKRRVRPSAIRQGALWWNHAFEQAGFKDAFVVKDLPEGATFLDARYSGIEWINRAERGWSVGGAQTDPRTGEILHGVARIEELAFLKLWIAHLLGRRIERALFEESIGLCALAVVLRRHPHLRAYESLT